MSDEDRKRIAQDAENYAGQFEEWNDDLRSDLYRCYKAGATREHERLQKEIPLDYIRIDFSIHGIDIFLKACIYYRNTRHLNNERERDEFEVLNETCQRITKAMKPHYK